MFIGELTDSELKRFNQYNRVYSCPICHKRILPCDGFEMTKVKNGRNIYYFFIHSNCLLSQLRRFQNGEENIKSEIRGEEDR